MKKRFVDLILVLVVLAASALAAAGFHDASGFHAEHEAMTKRARGSARAVDPKEVAALPIGTHVEVKGQVTRPTIEFRNSSLEARATYYNDVRYLAFRTQEANDFFVVTHRAYLPDIWTNDSLRNERAIALEAEAPPNMPAVEIAALREYLTRPQTFSGIVLKKGGETILVTDGDAWSTAEEEERRVMWSKAMPPLGLGTGGVVIGFASVIGLWRRARRRRWQEAARLNRRPQIAGETCAVCERDIVRERDATICEHCQAPLHLAMCHTRHVAQTHAAASTSRPYRDA